MNGGATGHFGWFLLFWIVYFTIVYSSLTFLYIKRRGRPPGGPDPVREADWENRDRELRRRLVRIGFGLMAAPLLLPFLLRWIR